MAGISPAILFLIVFLIILAAVSIKILREYERGVIFRLGRLIGAIPIDLLTTFLQKKEKE
jgi:regulator of protease activity HflC (stomatin/prohibitin superfamily)